MTKQLNYIDLFAGAGGLSEGFIQAGFNPIAHVEMDTAASYTLKTRIAYYHLKESGKIKDYISYLKGEIDRQQLYNLIPVHKLDSVINLAIGPDNNNQIFHGVDVQLENKEVDLLIGGPPCQAYSLVGRARSDNGMEFDPRNYLFIQYAKYLKKYDPKVFIFENVLGLKSAGGGRYFKSMLTLFDKLGYNVADFVFETDKFGVLQKRKRIILLGYKKELNFTVPNFIPEIQKPYLVENIFDDLPVLQAGEGVDKYTKYAKEKANEYLRESHIRNGINVLTHHICRPHTAQDKEIYKIAVELWNEKKERLSYNNLPKKLKTHQNITSFFDRFKVVASNLESSHTVVAHIAKDGHYYIHPDIDQNRSITVREAARLQSFPDDYFFEGVKEGRNRTAAFKQIGNAVPPLMAQIIAENLKKSYNV
jgi:DNA (cytosine-5)-methyltransferase 1